MTKQKITNRTYKACWTSGRINVETDNEGSKWYDGVYRTFYGYVRINANNPSAEFKTRCPRARKWIDLEIIKDGRIYDRQIEDPRGISLLGMKRLATRFAREIYGDRR